MTVIEQKVTAMQQQLNTIHESINAERSELAAQSNAQRQSLRDLERRLWAVCQMVADNTHAIMIKLGNPTTGMPGIDMCYAKGWSGNIYDQPFGGQ
jgi:hypothetical protein